MTTVGYGDMRPVTVEQDRGLPVCHRGVSPARLPVQSAVSNTSTTGRPDHEEQAALKEEQGGQSQGTDRPAEASEG